MTKRTNDPLPQIKKLTEDEVRALIKKGASVDDIAKKTGAEPKDVYRRLCELKLVRRL